MNEVVLPLNQVPSIQLSTKRFVYALLAVTYFILPISASIKSVTLTLCLFTILSVPSYRADVLCVFQTSWARAVSLFLGVVFIACFWGPGSLTDKWIAIEKYMKLLYLPVLVVVFRQIDAREMALKMVLLGVSLVSILSLLIYFRMVEGLPLDADRVFHNHIVFGFMGTYAAYISANMAVDKAHAKPVLWGIGLKSFGHAVLALILVFQVLWVNGGRMAYGLVLVLACLWMWQCLGWKKIALAFTMMCLVFCGVYKYSPNMHRRLTSAMSEFVDYRHSKLNTSLGYRVQMHHFAKQLFVKHLVLGNGTGSFRPLSDKQLNLPLFVSLRDPHSQYWLVAAEQGGVGLVVLFGVFISLFLSTYRLKHSGKLAVGLLIAMILSQLTDTMLFYSGPGCFFILVMAIYLGESYENSV